jgi:hypothetical protein
MLLGHISSNIGIVYGGDIPKNHGSVFPEKKSIGNKPDFFSE